MLDITIDIVGVIVMVLVSLATYKNHPTPAFDVKEIKD